MSRRRQPRRFQFQPWGEPLEGRALLSRGLRPPIGLVGGAVPRAIEPSNFHRQLVRTLAIRLNTSQQAASRISQAFQLYEQGMFGITPLLPSIPGSGTGTGFPSPPEFNKAPGGPQSPIVPVPAGVLPDPLTFENLNAQLTGFVDKALTNFAIRSSNVPISVRQSPKRTPLTQNSLIPFANQQIAQMAATIAANPPQFDQQTGELLNPEPKIAVETAFNNILNALGQYSVHPNLFVHPDDFYINPNVTFTIPFDLAPAQSMPGVYVLGPGGIPLPGVQRAPRR